MHDRDETEREPPAAGEREDRRGEERLLRAPETLAPEERRDLAVENMTSHQPDDALVAVWYPERRAVDPDTQRDAGDEGQTDDRLPDRRPGAANARSHSVIIRD